MNEQRLIDANTLVGADGLFATKGCTGCCDSCHLWSEEGCRVVLEAPTVNAIEVVHGHWESASPYFLMYRCSVCRKTTLFSICDFPSNYCPHCGAKMDGDNSEYVKN